MRIIFMFYGLLASFGWASNFDSEGRFVHPYLAVLESDKMHAESEEERAAVQWRIDYLKERTKNVLPTDDVDSIIMKTAFGQANCTQPNPNPIAGFTGGGAGSGKSQAVQYLYNQAGISQSSSVYVAPDEIMAAQSDYIQSEFVCRATWYHGDSSKAAADVYRNALAQNCNTVFDSTMQKDTSSAWRISQASQKGYQTVMVGTTIPTAIAATRAAMRGEDTNRWLTLDALVASHVSYSQNFNSYLPQLNHSYLLDTSDQTLQLIVNNGVVVNESLMTDFLNKKYDTTQAVNIQLSIPVQREYQAIAACPTTPPSAGSQIWVYNTASSIQSQPIVHQGAVFVGSLDASLQALDISDGSVFWKSTMPAGVTSGLSISADGSTLYASLANGLVAINSISGAVLWQASLANGAQTATPVVAGNQVLSSDFETGAVFALNTANGNTNWNLAADNSGRQLSAKSAGFSPDIANGIAFAAQGGYVVAVNANTGAVQWQSKNFTANQTVSVPALTNGNLFFASDEGVHAVSASTGNLLWTADIPKPVQVICVGNHAVFGGSKDGNLYAINLADGSILWKIKFSTPFSSSGPVIHNNVLYIGNQNALSAVDVSAGKALWNFQTTGSVETTPYIANGTVYVGNQLGAMFAVAAGVSSGFSSSGSGITPGEWAGIGAGIVAGVVAIATGVYKFFKGSGSSGEGGSLL